jgi:hypothetical protein
MGRIPFHERAIARRGIAVFETSHNLFVIAGSGMAGSLPTCVQQRLNEATVSAYQPQFTKSARTLGYAG